MDILTYYYPDGHEGHFETGNPERPARIEAIQAMLDEHGFWAPYPKLPPAALERELLERVHSTDLLDTLAHASGAGGHIDSDTFFTANSWQLALNAAGGAVAVAHAVYPREAHYGFALCRPPGHHATPNRAMGFCLLNNVALAAEHVLQETPATKVAILDIDVHHGNGTQDIFYERSDVLFISIHQSPLYPGTGHVGETGGGDGAGTTINIPLPPYAGDQAREASLHEVILPALTRFAPDMLLISAGYDAHWKDPLAHQLATTAGYGQMIRELRSWADAHCEGRLALILEGGYDLGAIASSATACVAALLDHPFEDPIGGSTIAEEDDWTHTIASVKRTHSL